MLIGGSHSTHWMFTMLIYNLKFINLKCLIILKYIKTMIDFDQLWFKLINKLFLLTGCSHSTHEMFTMLTYVSLCLKINKSYFKVYWTVIDFDQLWFKI